MLNWIVWIRTVYMYKNEFGINDVIYDVWCAIKPIQNEHTYPTRFNGIIAIPLQEYFWH